MKKSGSVVGALVMVIAGVLLFVYPASSLTAGVRLLGFAILLYGAIGLVTGLTQKKESRSMPSLIYFALFTIAGIILIANPGFIISIFPIIAGVMIAVSGAESLMRALKLKKRGHERGLLMVILAVITIAFGILIFANPFATQALLVRVFACGLIYNGVVKLILSVI